MVFNSLKLWFNSVMLKSEAIELLGGDPSAAAEVMNISYQAVNKWPECLPRRISDRVLGACVRRGISVPCRFLEVSASAKCAENPPPAPAHKAPAAINSEARQQAQEGVHV